MSYTYCSKTRQWTIGGKVFYNVGLFDEQRCINKLQWVRQS